MTTDDILPPIDIADDEADEQERMEYEEVLNWFRFRVRPECDTSEVPF